MTEPTDLRAGIRQGLPLVLPTFALGISFGVLAQPVMGSVAPIVMSIVVFSGAAQFAALTVLAAGGGAVTAVLAGMLMNLRWLPMGFAVGPFLPGRPLARVAQSMAIVDASFVLSSRGDGTYDRGVLIGASLAQGSAWVLGTVAGVLGGGLLGDPQALGLDAIFVAFYAALLASEARGRPAIAAAVIGGAVALALMPVAPAGVPVLAASLGALLGLTKYGESLAVAGADESKSATAGGDEAQAAGEDGRGPAVGGDEGRGWAAGEHGRGPAVGGDEGRGRAAGGSDGQARVGGRGPAAIQRGAA
jgi:predicted branched-subunit amino acid permease